MFVCLWYPCQWRSEEGVRSPRAGVTCGCEHPDAGARHRIWVLSETKVLVRFFGFGFIFLNLR